MLLKSPEETSVSSLPVFVQEMYGTAHRAACHSTTLLESCFSLVENWPRLVTARVSSKGECFC